LSRAKEHLNSLELQLLSPDDGSIELVPEKDGDRGILRINIKPKPSKKIGLIAGEFLYQIRSSLDHIVWHLVDTNPLAKHSTSDMFPICSNRGLFDAQVKRGRLHGVPAKAHAIIEALQPYNGGDNPLGILTKLHDVDEHRVINLTTAVAGDTVIE
jgi:hypothetical protein